MTNENYFVKLFKFDIGVVMAKTKSTKTIKNTKKTKAAPAKSGAAKKKAAAPLKKGPKAKQPVKPKAKKTSPPAPKKILKLASKTEGKLKTTPKKQKNNLSPREKTILAIRFALAKQKEAILNDAEMALNELPGQTIFPDLGDQASAETDRNFMLRLRGREQRLLKKIEAALDRIENGTFGICDDCGNEIEIKRLEARPVATMCIECKTLQEEEEKLREQ